MFSVINPAIVRSAAFYQDGFPARYGGRLGSLLDVRSREGNTEYASAEIALSSIATKLSIEIPTFKNRGALLLTNSGANLPTDLWVPATYDDPSEVGEVEDRLVRSFPILPSLSYSIKFGE